MNKIKNLEALGAMRDRLPDQRVQARRKSKAEQAPDPSPEPLSPDEAIAYGEAFDALLTLWQAIGGMPSFKLPPHVAKAQASATMRLRPLLDNAMKVAS